MSTHWSSPVPGPVTEVTTAHERLSSRDLDQLFLLHAAALQTGEAVAQWWFSWRADAQDVHDDASLSALLRDSLQGIALALGADAVAVLLADDNGELVVRAAVGLEPELWREIHIASGAGMAGRIYAERRAVVVDDLSKVEVVSDTLRHSGVRSLVAVPVAAGSRVMGVLHADSRQLAHFDDNDAAMMAVVADRLGAALEQVRLFEAERAARAEAESAAARLERLQRITVVLSRDLTSEGIAEVLLGELAADIGGAPDTHLLWEVEGGRLRLLAGVEQEHLASAFAEMSTEDALPGPEVVRTRVPLWLGSPEEIGRFPALASGDLEVQSLAVLPLVVEGEVLGVLAVGYAVARRFEENERRFLAVVAQQTADALHRARIRQARARDAFANALLADVSAALGSSLDSRDTLRRALEELVPRFADVATFHLFDELGVPRRQGLRHRDLEGEAAFSVTPDDGPHEAESVLVTLASAGSRPLLVPARGEIAEEIAFDEDHAAEIRDLGITSAIAVPLSARGEDFGLLGLMRLQGSDPYGEADLSLASEIGARASDAIDNALQHERRVALSRALQASLLPPELPTVPGVEVAAVFHPASTGVDVGGDFYDLFPVDDERWVLMVGDVSGSGPAAAALTAQVRHGARVAARAGLEPSAVVAAVNATLDETTGSEWFCTMVYSEMVPHPGGVDLQIICAGHVPPILVAGGVVEQLECQAPLLGVLPGATFTSRPLRLAPGHALVMVTDGATEARAPGRRGPDTFFGEDRLQRVLAEASMRHAEGMVHAIADAVLAFTGGHLDDDLALVAVRVPPVQNLAQ